MVPAGRPESDREGRGMGVTGEGVVDRSRPAQRWPALAAIASAVVAVDQFTKEAVRASFEPGEGMHAFGAYWIQHFQNAGVSGGGLEGRALPLAVLSMMGVVLLYDFLAPRSRARLSLAVGFGLLVGGGLGNLVDRWRLGLVTDFIRSGERAFNIADVAIFSGGLIILTALVVTLVRILVQGPAAVQPTSRGG
jgi:signal peptidase II